MKGQVALVTGASRGIGLGVAVELAKRGFSVALNGSKDLESLNAAERQVANAGSGRVALIPFDVADTQCHESAIERAEAKLGPLTTLVNNAGAGVASRGDILDVSEESWDRCLSVNAKAMFFLSQAFTKRLLARKRNPILFYSIVNVTSANAVAVAATRAEYCASKAAAAMVSKAFAVRLGGEGIPVFDVQPGLIRTSMTEPVIENYAERARSGLTLFPRVGTPEEIGQLIGGLASGSLPYTTGQAISADGGLLVSRF
ncbi:MAG: 3-ketoacyl-ACP reductase [Albidovulum sp.]|nr:3-ketoacyl-ACP reductase [Albidovulum sp.]